MDQPKYRIEIFWSDEDGGYIANVPDLLYCSAFGESYEEALREVLVAMELHLDTLREMGRPIPEASSSAVSLASEPAEAFAEAFADAIWESYEAALTKLRTQAESNMALPEDLLEEQRKQQEALQALAQESVKAYTEFLERSRKSTRN
jgi:predicted RNase H-like HicB family nuclease